MAFAAIRVWRHHRELVGGEKGVMMGLEVRIRTPKGEPRSSMDYFQAACGAPQQVCLGCPSGSVKWPMLCLGQAQPKPLVAGEEHKWRASNTSTTRSFNCKEPWDRRGADPPTVVHLPGCIRSPQGTFGSRRKIPAPRRPAPEHPTASPQRTGHPRPRNFRGGFQNP